MEHIRLIALAIALAASPAAAQYDYPHSAFIPYGAGSPLQPQDYYGGYRNPTPWFSAPRPLSGYVPYYPSDSYIRSHQQFSPHYPGKGWMNPPYWGR